MGRELTYDDVIDAQGQFRLLLDAMSRPGKINRFPEMEIHTPGTFRKTSAMVAFALLNADASFHCVSDHEGQTARYIQMNTSAKIVDAAGADFIFLNGDEPAGSIIEVKTGSLTYPEEGATLVVGVEEIAAVPVANSVQLRLKGPGVKKENILYVSGLSQTLLVEIVDKNAEFPLGVDTIFCDCHGQIAALPRTSHISFD